MSLATRFVSALFGLPPATGKKLESYKDLAVPMPDGTVLYADRIAPAGGRDMPSILIRTPYTSRRDWFIMLLARLIAERGYHVIIQNCRGTWGSGGEWFPFRDDREDGLATLEWASKQPWFNGSIGMFGVSYWGYAQIASGPDAPDYLKALVPQMSASRLYSVFRNRGTLSFLLTLTWNYSTFVTQRQTTMRGQMRAYSRGRKTLASGFNHLPAGESDKAALGFTSPFYQNILQNEDAKSAFWASMDFSGMVDKINAPVHFIAGWYDFFLTDELADYAALKAAGKNPYLTVGPWTHAGSIKDGLKESLAWYDAYLRNNRSSLRGKPVKVCVIGTNDWVDLESWPPPYSPAKLYLSKNGGLSEKAADDGDNPSRYRYDPADPTPSIGGAVVTPDPGPRNNAKIESRPDVLTFTSEPMARNTTIMGLVSAELFVRSSLEHTDFFVRLCDVSPNGKSVNICDGLVRLTPGTPRENDGIVRIDLALTDTACCFKTGHRIRIQVSSGAHPLFIRNLGTGEPLATATGMQAADQEVFHDGSHPSAVILPVVSIPGKMQGNRGRLSFIRNSTA